MNIKFIKKLKRASLAVFFLSAALVSAQEIQPEEKTEEVQNNRNIQETEQNNEESENPEKKEEDELQKNFVIIESAHNFNLNPQTANYSAEAQILTGLYEGLFSYDPITLDPVYAIATSHRLSRDKKRWTFVLREDAKFSDGLPITAQDVKNSWLSLIANPNAPFASLFDIVKGAKEFRTKKGSAENVGIYAIDEHTISVRLNAPAAHLPKLLCMPTFSVTGKELSLFSGPFVLAERTPFSIILKRNENYYDAKNTKLAQITILLSDDPEENTYAFNSGAADWIASSFEEKKLISQDSIHLCAEFATQYFFFKFRENSLWNNADLRRALLEAVPWNELRANTYVPAQSLVYALNGYPNVEGYVFSDESEAKFLMKEARKNLSVSEEEKLKLTFAIPANDYMKNKAELLKKAWEPLGVELEIAQIPDSEYLNSIKNSNAELFSYTWIGDFADPLAFLELFRGNSTMNESGWKNEEFDSLLDEAALHTDENHNKILAKAEQLLLDEALILPIQHPVSVNIIDLNAVGGWSINAFDIHPLKYLFKRETKPNIPNIVMITK